MRLGSRNKETMYIAKLTDTKDDYGKPIYDKPFVFKANLAPVDSSSEITIYGSRVSKMQKSIVVRKLYENKFKENDVAYLDGVKPDGEKVNGSKANYRIESIRKYHKSMTIYFEKL